MISMQRYEDWGRLWCTVTNSKVTCWLICEPSGEASQYQQNSWSVSFCQFGWHTIDACWRANVISQAVLQHLPLPQTHQWHPWVRWHLVYVADDKLISRFSAVTSSFSAILQRWRNVCSHSSRLSSLHIKHALTWFTLTCECQVSVPQSLVYAVELT